VVVNAARLVAPDQYELTISIPEWLAEGDQPISAMYNGLVTQSGAVITIRN
jgi:hypothetical protein